MTKSILPNVGQQRAERRDAVLQANLRVQIPAVDLVHELPAAAAGRDDAHAVAYGDDFFQSGFRPP